MTTTLHIAFHYHVPAIQREDGIFMPGYLGRFVEGLAANCAKVTCFMHSPRPGQLAEMDYRIEAPNVVLVDIGVHASVPRRLLRSRDYVRPFREQAEAVDVLLIRGPSPLLPAFAATSRSPVALLLVGSYVDGVDDLSQPWWRKELIRAWSWLNQVQQDLVARHALVFVNSRKLHDYYLGRSRCLVETRTTTLTEADFYERPAADLRGRPVRLLYAGRFDRAKGLLEMVEAVKLLKEGGTPAVLELVGWEDGNTGVIEELMALADRLGVADCVFNHGRRAVGPQLFQHYRDADIYLIGSKANEGFPRTIWEAMAHSMPVVATSLESIRHFVEGAAELVEPGSPQAMADGIRRVILDETLRQERVAAGLRLARANTTEFRSREMTQHLEQWVAQSEGER